MFAYIQSQWRLLWREKLTWICIFILPLAMVTVLVTAFSENIGQAVVISNYKIGYEIIREGTMSSSFMDFQEKTSKEQIETIQMSKEEAISKLNKGEILLYVEIEGETYKTYIPKYFKKESVYCKGIVEQSLNYNLGKEDKKQYLSVEQIDEPFIASSSDYYVIADTVCNIWFCIFPAVYLGHLERKNRLSKRIVLGKLSFAQRFLGRWIVTSTLGILQVLFFVGIGSISFHANWGGEKMYLSILILLIEVIIVAGIGTNISYLIKSYVLSNIVWLSLWWMLSFLGGGYQGYSSQLLPEYIKGLSPLYYINRGIIEMVYKGEYTYLFKVKYVLGILFILDISLFVLNSLLYKRRRLNV